MSGSARSTREDGQTVYALIHDEYHGWEHPGMCPPNQPANDPCWYNAITLAVSTDAGDTFRPIATPPRHFVATLPFRYDGANGVTGLMEPSNIIKRDGWYYFFARAHEPRGSTVRSGECSIPTPRI